MSDTRPAIKGYRAQTDQAIDIVNKNKELEETVLRQLDAIWLGSLQDDYDARWVAIARTHIELGFMALNRSIFMPGRVSLPEDAA